MAINIGPSVDEVLKSGFDVVWVPKAKSWLEWNRDIHAWVVVSEEYIDSKVKGILHNSFQVAIMQAAQDPTGSEEILENAIKVMKEPQIKRIVNALKVSKREEPDVLQTRLSEPLPEKAPRVPINIGESEGEDVE